MNGLNDKSEITNLDSKLREDQRASDCADGTVLELKALEEISAGSDPISPEAIYGIKRAEDRMRQTARDIYRKEHPYAHPDDVENAIKATFAHIGVEGQSGA